MASGQINGSAFLATDTDKTNGILIPTVVQMSRDMLDYWLNMTCLYDPYWTPTDDKVTLPICMFHVKKETITRTVETSKKRVILYEPRNDNALDPKDATKIRSGVMQTIVDNAVKQPVTYQLEVIVPFLPTGRYITDGINAFRDIGSGIGQIVGGDGYETVRYWESVLAGTHSILKLAEQTINTSNRLPMPDTDGASYINMNSLEAMADSCRVLCMKRWTGFDYKYAMITGMVPDKQPTEDDVFRATITLQEMPVLEMFIPKEKRINKSKRNWSIVPTMLVQGAASEVLMKMTMVEKETGINSAKVFDRLMGKV